jgi:hypothetical protein
MELPYALKKHTRAVQAEDQMNAGCEIDLTCDRKVIGRKIQKKGENKVFDRTFTTKKTVSRLSVPPTSND